MAATAAAMILFYLGFFEIGKKYGQPILKGFSVYFIIISIAAFAAGIFMVPVLESYMGMEGFENFERESNELIEKYGGENNIPEDELSALVDKYGRAFLDFFLFILGLLVIFIAFWGIPMIFFGVGLIKLKDSVEYSKPAGILNIVAGSTMIIFIGLFLWMVAFVFNLILLFKESEKKVKQL